MTVLVAGYPTSLRHHVSAKWIAVVAASAVILAGGWLWTYRATELTQYRADGGVEVEYVGETHYISQVTGPYDSALHDTTIDITNIQPVIMTNTAHASVHVLVCTGLTGIGGSDTSVATFCRSAKPWKPGAIDMSHHELILAVSPTQAGRVEVAGLEIHFRDGIRHGKQHTGTEVGAIVPS